MSGRTYCGYCLFFLLLLATAPGCAPRGPSLPKDIADTLPKEEDFEFRAPEGWGINLLKDARLVSTTAEGGINQISRMVDGKPATSWAGKGYGHRPQFTLDFGREVEFNRLVIYNRHTDMRGTGGGNNAAKDLVISASVGSSPDSFALLSETTLPGPRAQCAPVEDKHVCFYVDNTDPTIIILPRVKSRFIRIQIASAYWLPPAETQWPTELSYALSEVMAFMARN